MLSLLTKREPQPPQWARPGHAGSRAEATTGGGPVGPAKLGDPKETGVIWVQNITKYGDLLRKFLRRNFGGIDVALCMETHFGLERTKNETKRLLSEG